MQESPEMQDPASGYASADVLDPAAPVNRDRSREGDGEEMQDAMNGYASADTLDLGADVNRPAPAPPGADTLLGPTSSYNSGANDPNP
ncbi:MAG TPA: hypothetical protein VK066_24475 [Chloroflexota bacterium]|nr:hypothetical protein [Chloroflexota bacterium]